MSDLKERLRRKVVLDKGEGKPLARRIIQTAWSERRIVDSKEWTEDEWGNLHPTTPTHKGE